MSALQKLDSFWRRKLWENGPPRLACGAIFLVDNWCGRAQPTHRAVGSGCFQKACSSAHGGRASRQGPSMACVTVPAFRVLPGGPVSFPSVIEWSQSCGWNKVFAHQVLFGYGAFLTAVETLRQRSTLVQTVIIVSCFDTGLLSYCFLLSAKW